MASKTAAAATEAVEAEVEAELTPKQIINEGIGRVIEATGIDSQKNRYKAMRAIAFQAFVESIDSGDFDDLVTRAIAAADSLPSGWELERVASEDAPAKTTKATPSKAPAKRAPSKAAAAKTGTASARRRPTR